MDVETSEAIGRLGERIDALEVSLRTEFRGGLAESRAEFRQGFVELRTEIREGLAESRVELRAEFREAFAESRRHAEVLLKSLRDDIRILAEGFAVLSAKLDALRR
jgi:hypothetical protein